MKKFRIHAMITVGVEYTVTAENEEAAHDAEVNPTKEFGNISGVLRLEGPTVENVEWCPNDCYPEPQDIREIE